MRSAFEQGRFARCSCITYHVTTSYNAKLITEKSKLQDVAYACQCFIVEYMLLDHEYNEGGALPRHTPEILRKLEADVHNKRVSIDFHLL